MSPNNNRYNTTITPSPPPHSAAREGSNGQDVRFKYRTFGEGGFVRMTDEQYDALLRMVDRDTLDEYIFRMEMLLSVPAKNGTGYVHSPYHTIKKWINDDAAL